MRHDEQQDAVRVIWDERPVTLPRIIYLVLARYLTLRAGCGIWRASHRYPGATFSVTSRPDRER